MLTLEKDLELMIDEYSSEVYSKYQTIAYNLRACGDCYNKAKIAELKLLIEAKNTNVEC